MKKFQYLLLLLFSLIFSLDLICQTKFYLSESLFRHEFLSKGPWYIDNIKSHNNFFSYLEPKEEKTAFEKINTKLSLLPPKEVSKLGIDNSVGLEILKVGNP
jgi:hypothetical protein